MLMLRFLNSTFFMMPSPLLGLGIALPPASYDRWMTLIAREVRPPITPGFPLAERRPWPRICQSAPLIERLLPNRHDIVQAEAPAVGIDRLAGDVACVLRGQE